MMHDRETAYLSRIQAFARDEIAPAAAAWSMGAEPEKSVFKRAAELGLMGLELPAERGGGGFGFALKARVCRALAAADFGFAMSVVNTHNVAKRLWLSGAEALKEQVVPQLLSGQANACTALTEPGAGSDLSGMTTRAEETPEGWRLHGEKSWIVNSRNAGYAIVFAQCGKAGDIAGIGSFLVDLSAPGVTRYPLDSPFAQSSIGSGGFRLDGVALPRESLLQPPGAAIKAILQEINGARAYVAAMCCGMLQAALAEAAGYGERRQSFGSRLSDHQGWRQPLAEARSDLAAAEALTEVAVARVAEADEAAQLTAAEAKIVAVETCQRHLPRLLHAMGAAGLQPQYCLARHLAAAQSAALTDGATSLLKDRVARLTRPTEQRK